MNLLTQVNLGEIQEFLNVLDDNILLIPSWNHAIPSDEDPDRVSLFRVSRGTVRTLKTVIQRAMTTRLNGRRYNSQTLVDVRNGSSEGSLTLGMLIASVRPWKELGDSER